MILAKIAIKNVMANKKRSFLLGFVIFLSTLVLLLSNGAMNGVEKQVTKGYRYLQAADVIVIWDNLKKIGNEDTARLLFLTNTSFNPTLDDDNQKALTQLNNFLNEHFA